MSPVDKVSSSPGLPARVHRIRRRTSKWTRSLDSPNLAGHPELPRQAARYGIP